MCEKKIQKLPIVDAQYKLKSLICLKDIKKYKTDPVQMLIAMVD